MNHGFTLLEVMVAMAILALALTALLGHQAVAIQMSDYSNRVSQANLLAYGKLLDLEHKLRRESIDVLDNCEDGDFGDDGFRNFEWKACAYKLELGDGATERITEQVMSGLSGMMPGMDMASPDSMSDDMLRQLGQIQQGIAAVPFFLERLEDQVRKVRLEVSWRDAIEDRSLVVERFVTLLGAEASGAAPPADGKAEASPDLQDVIDAVAPTTGAVGAPGTPARNGSNR